MPGKFSSLLLYTALASLFCCKAFKPASSVTIENGPNLPVGLYEMGYATDGKIIFSVGGSTFLGNLRQPVGEIYLYSPFGGDWQKGRFTDKPMVKGPASSVYLPGFNWLVSTGFPEVQRGDIQSFPLEVLDLRTYTITYLRTAPYWAVGSGIVHWNGKIYVFGGVGIEEDGSSRFSNQLMSYDPTSGRWEDLHAMPGRRMTYGVVVGNNLYTFGGFDGERSYADIWRYDFENNYWETVGYLPYPSSHFSVSQKYPYVFLTNVGNKKNIIGRVDIRDGSFREFETWVTVTSPGSAVIGDHLYIFGGSWDDGRSASNKTFKIPLEELMADDELEKN